jgi:predicted nucleic acid-binding protein
VRLVFADTFYWISLANPRDEWHQRVSQVSPMLQSARIITTDEIVVEFLNYYSELGPELRATACDLARRTLHAPGVETISQSRQGLLNGVQLYERRLDKGYSLTDCISMQLMRERGIIEVLTHDHHFTQEGFTILFL